MIVSSAQVYDESTIEHMLELKLEYDVCTGMPFSLNGWPLLMERCTEIKDQIGIFLDKYPELKAEVIEY